MASINLVGDFETNNGSDGVNETRVWASALCDIETNEVVQLGTSLEGTILYLYDMTKYYKKNINVYYHNLKFDGKFIVDYLLNNGFTYNEDLDSKKSFSTLISDMGVWYGVNITWGGGKNAKKVKIMDSLKIFPMTVERLAKSFKLDTLKGSIDYDYIRPLNHKLTKEEREYLINDVKIVASCLKENFDNGMTKMTASSNAMAEYKDIIGKTNFSYLFPKLSKEDDKIIRDSYKGGYTYCNPKFQGKDLYKNGVVYDVNSLYPSVMYNELLPYGMPVYFKGEYNENIYYPLFIQVLECEFKLKKGKIPIIQIKGNLRFSDSEYLKDSGIERVRLTVTNVDLEMIKAHYDLFEVEYIEGFMFRGQKDMFKAYIDKWSAIKKESTGGKRELAKLMLNSLYGKFATNPKSIVKIPYLENGIVKYKAEEKEDRKIIYTAISSFICAYARKITITGAMNNIEHFAYCDTDSIHLVDTTTAKNIEIHHNKLGAWKCEGYFTYAKYLRAKTYIEDIIVAETGDIKLVKLDVKCAGMPPNCKKGVTKSNFKVGATFGGKLSPKTVKGGVILVPTEFTIKK